MRAVTALLVIVVNISLFSAPSQANPRRRVVHPAPRVAPKRVVVVRPPVGARRVVISGSPYWVHGGVYYRHDHDGYVVVKAPVLRVLPRRHRVVVIRGSVYYVSDGVYYRTAPGGYVVVEKPAEVVVTTPQAPKPPAPAPSTVTLYVPKRAEEGFASVTLKKLDGGYLGPQGEFYPTMPAVALLTEMYGIAEASRQTRSDVYFIHVPNKDGASYTRVTLQRKDGGFVGPQGEFYPLVPSVAHLTEMYGAAPESTATEEGIVRVNVPNKSGEGSTQVELKKHEQGYVGPQGEFYPELPSAETLAELYGGQ